MNARRPDPSGITFVFAELALSLNVLLWLFYAHRPAGALMSLALMLVVWRAHKWASQ